MRRRIGLKVSTVRSKVMVLAWKEGLECEVYIDRICLEHVLECVSGADETECSRKMEDGVWEAGCKSY